MTFAWAAIQSAIAPVALNIFTHRTKVILRTTMYQTLEWTKISWTLKNMRKHKKIISDINGLQSGTRKKRNIRTCQPPLLISSLQELRLILEWRLTLLIRIFNTLKQPLGRPGTQTKMMTANGSPLLMLKTNLF